MESPSLADAVKSTTPKLNPAIVTEAPPTDGPLPGENDVTAGVSKVRKPGTTATNPSVWRVMLRPAPEPETAEHSIAEFETHEVLRHADEPSTAETVRSSPPKL